jgi:hypothetical protein
LRAVWTEDDCESVQSVFSGWMHFNDAGALVVFGSDNAVNYGFLRITNTSNGESHCYYVNNRDLNLNFGLNDHGMVMVD